MTLIWWLLERCVYTVDSQPYTHMIQKKTKIKKTQRNIAAYQKQRMKAKQQQKSTPKDYTHRVYFFYMLHRILVWIRDVRAYNARGSVKPSTAHCTILYTIYLYCVVAPSALRGVRTMLKREKEIACVLLLLLGQFQCGSNPTKKKKLYTQRRPTIHWLKIFTRRTDDGDGVGVKCVHFCTQLYNGAWCAIKIILFHLFIWIKTQKEWNKHTHRAREGWLYTEKNPNGKLRRARSKPEINFARCVPFIIRIV